MNRNSQIFRHIVSSLRQLALSTSTHPTCKHNEKLPQIADPDNPGEGLPKRARNGLVSDPEDTRPSIEYFHVSK